MSSMRLRSLLKTQSRAARLSFLLAGRGNLDKRPMGKMHSLH
jgi:hypothetical protein